MEDWLQPHCRQRRVQKGERYFESKTKQNTKTNKTKPKSKLNRLNNSASYRDALLSCFGVYLFQLHFHDKWPYATCARKRQKSNKQTKPDGCE